MVAHRHHAEADFSPGTDDPEASFAEKNVLPGKRLFDSLVYSSRIGNGKQIPKLLLIGRYKVSGRIPEDLQDIQFPVTVKQK